MGYDDAYVAALTRRLTTVVVPMEELSRAAFRCAVVEPLRDEVELTAKLVIHDAGPNAVSGPVPPNCHRRGGMSASVV